MRGTALRPASSLEAGRNSIPRGLRFGSVAGVLHQQRVRAERVGRDREDDTEGSAGTGLSAAHAVGGRFRPAQELAEPNEIRAALAFACELERALIQDRLANGCLS